MATDCREGHERVGASARQRVGGGDRIKLEDLSGHDAPLLLRATAWICNYSARAERVRAGSRMHALPDSVRNDQQVVGDSVQIVDQRGDDGGSRKESRPRAIERHTSAHVSRHGSRGSLRRIGGEFLEQEIEDLELVTL